MVIICTVPFRLTALKADPLYGRAHRNLKGFHRRLV
jgi:hypothetical protein